MPSLGESCTTTPRRGKLYTQHSEAPCVKEALQNCTMNYMKQVKR